VFERPKAKAAVNTVGPDSSAKLGPARLVNGKVVHAKSKIGGKQMTLGAMMKKAPAQNVSSEPLKELTPDEEGGGEEGRPGGAVPERPRVWWVRLVASR
jgi:hypothetical protein